MNTATASLRLVVAASVVALATCLAGCATPSPSLDSRGRLVSAHVDAAMHRGLVHEAADRYVLEMLVRARLAHEASPPPRILLLTRVHGR